MNQAKLERETNMGMSEKLQFLRGIATISCKEEEGDIHEHISTPHSETRLP